MTMPAGEYYIGDLCYVLSEDAWDEICTSHLGAEGEVTLKDGRKIAIFTTAYGDGEYKDNCYGYDYGVDSGTIGCILYSQVDKNTDGEVVMQFLNEFSVYKEGSQLNFGHIMIDTDPQDDWESSNEWQDSGCYQEDEWENSGC